VEFEGLRFRRDYVQSGAMTISARVSPEEEPRIEAEVQTDSLNIRSLGYRSGTASLDVTRSEGRIRVTTVRSDRERYSAQGTYALESRERGTLNLDELNLEFDMVRWNLGGPALFEWSPEGYRIRDFQVVRSGDRSMRFRADGFLPLGGREGNFDLEAEGLNLARIARTLQMETPLEGSADFRGTATGTSDDPVIVGAFSGRDLRYGQFSLDGVESDLNYRNRRIDLELEATEAGTQVLSASGYFPLDLRIDSDSARMADAPVDLAFSMDSFPAALALAFMNSMEEVEGTLSGGVRLGGTRGDLQPEGELRLSGGSARFPGLGVRHRDVEARLVLTPDGVVQVDGTLRSGGTASVVGTVDLAGTPSNPALDLDVEARDFLAVDRRDVRGRVSGSMFVDDRYRSPLVTGSLTAQEGVLFVEEVARSVEVVDLSDPTFFDVVDTTLVTLRPIIRGSQNPFLQNLRLRLNLTMAQDSWLRGRDMNIEMAGALDVFWDRTAQDLTFLGNLNAVRGTYSVFNRQFQVQEGTVSFPGVPGINPDLDIRAMNRLRTPKNEQLEIIATVEGSLLEPRVSLSGNSAFPIADDDLVSYLVFGQPSHAVGQGLSRAASEGASAALRGATASFAVGLFSLELGQILARDLGLDYLAVTQGVVDPDASGGNRGFLSGAAGTQVEIGQYLSDDIFAALRWRPLASGSNLSRFAALRVESRLGDRWTLEGYLEDRFLRTSLFLLAFDDPEFKSEFSLGFFLYREWGY
ncbi:MAG: translocation/assembly module TamB, partial [Gemmatimonadetes bacterium]|nr:translocation/assembly module TamB [Gemmatimonadota bacterium]